jgi:hypothetical protein
MSVRRLTAAALLLLPRFVSGVSLPPLVCSSGGAIGTVDLRVDPSRAGEKPLPLRTINRLEEGETVTYRPILRQSEQRKGEVDIVLLPAAGAKANSKRPIPSSRIPRTARFSFSIPNPPIRRSSGKCLGGQAWWFLSMDHPA